MIWLSEASKLTHAIQCDVESTAPVKQSQAWLHLQPPSSAGFVWTRAAATCLSTLIEIGWASDFVIDAARWFRFLPITRNLTFRRFPTVTLLVPWICRMGSSRLFAQGRSTMQAQRYSAFLCLANKGLPEFASYGCLPWFVGSLRAKLSPAGLPAQSRVA